MVLQRALSDFYAEYQLVGRIDRAEDRVPILSALHERVQDAFNEFGVQIMSPHFERQPQEKVVVSKELWHAPPAEDVDSEATGSGS